MQKKENLSSLIAFNIYKKEDKQLFELTLTELEHEYRRFQAQCHPHDDIGSIQWSFKKSQQ